MERSWDFQCCGTCRGRSLATAAAGTAFSVADVPPASARRAAAGLLPMVAKGEARSRRRGRRHQATVASSIASDLRVVAAAARA